MAHAGDTIENPRTGELIIFRRTATDGDDVLQFDYEARPGTAGPPEHIHLEQEERFTVTAGIARFRVAGRDIMRRAGESAAVPPGTPHTFTNDGPDQLRMTIEISPARQMERFFETLFGLGRDGKLAASGGGMLQDAVLAHEYGVFLARPPLAIQRPAVAVMAFVGRLLGTRASYERYSAPKDTRPDH